MAKAIPQIHNKLQGNLSSSILKKNEVGGLTSWFQNLLQSYSKQNTVVVT